MDTSVETLVLGAGISGLACAHALGPGALVLEGSARAGGLVHTCEQEGFRFEQGPEALPGSAHAVRELAGELGLELHDVPGELSRRYLLRAGRVLEVPTGPGALIRTPLLSTRAKLRLLAEPWRAGRRHLEGSIADFVAHRLGAEVVERLLDPLVAGIHAGDPAQLSMRACFPQVLALVEQHGSFFAALRARRRARARPDAALAAPPVPGPAGHRSPPGAGLWKPALGMEALTRALVRALGDRLVTGAPVRRLERVGQEFRVRSADGRGWRTSRLVLALPLGPTRELLGELAPAAAGALSGMQAESLVSVVHGYRREDVEHPLDGFGYLCSSRESASLLGTLFSSTILPGSAPDGHVLLRTLAGGARSPGLVELGDEELLSRVEGECRAPLGLRRGPVFRHVSRYRAAIPRYDLQHPERQRRLAAALPAGLAVLGNFERGIGLGALVLRAREVARELGAAAVRT